MKVSFANHEAHTSIAKVKRHILREHKPHNVEAEKETIILHDETLQEAYEKAYGKALADYNNKQKKKHPERCMTPAEYLQKIIEEEKSYQPGARHPYYGSIIQVGNKDDPMKDIEVLKNLYNEWYDRNSKYIHVISAVIHTDEENLHIHVEWCPTAHSTRGLSIKNSVSQALTQLLDEHGIHIKEKSRYNNPYLYWEQYEVTQMEKSCREMGLDIEPSEQIVPTQERLEEIRNGTHKPSKYRPIEKYRSEKQKEAAEQKIEEANQKVAKAKQLIDLVRKYDEQSERDNREHTR